MSGEELSWRHVLARLRERQELRPAAALWRADRPMAVGWWGLLAARGLLPVGFAIATGLLVARDFDRGMTGPPLSISMDFIASSLVNMVAGLAQACVLFGFTWWAPPALAGSWLGTHWLLRESAVWRDRNTPEVRQAQRDADYAYRLAVDPPAAKELRIFGLPDWVLERLDEPTAALDAETEHQLFERYAATAREARKNGSVTILVSHRFSTVRMADFIVVLDGARVAEAGSHEELLARDGRYADLYRIQAAGYS